MRSIIRITMISVIAAALMPSFDTGAEPAPPRREVVSLRYWTAPEHTRIVLDMSSVDFIDTPSPTGSSSTSRREGSRRGSEN